MKIFLFFVLISSVADAQLPKCISLGKLGDNCRPKEIQMTDAVKSTLEFNNMDVSAFRQVQTYKGRFVVESKEKTEIYGQELPPGTFLEFSSFNGNEFEIQLSKNWMLNGVEVKKFSLISVWIESTSPQMRLSSFTLAKSSMVNGLMLPAGTEIRTHYEKGQTMEISPGKTFKIGDEEFVRRGSYWVNDCKPSAKAKGHWKSTAASMDNHTCPGLWDGREKKKLDDKSK